MTKKNTDKVIADFEAAEKKMLENEEYVQSLVDKMADFTKDSPFLYDSINMDWDQEYLHNPKAVEAIADQKISWASWTTDMNHKDEDDGTFDFGYGEGEVLGSWDVDLDFANEVAHHLFGCNFMTFDKSSKRRPKVRWSKP